MLSIQDIDCLMHCMDTEDTMSAKKLKLIDLRVFINMFLELKNL